MQAFYRTLTRGARRVAGVLARGDGKLAQSIRGRERAAANLRVWGHAERDPRRPVAWFHASSVGETHQAVAVMDALRELDPDLQIVFTHSSPSAEGIAARLTAGATDYLPWDLPEMIEPLLEAVRPNLLVFTQKEVWPTLALAASEGRAAVALIAGLLPPDSGRLRWPTRSVLLPAMERLSLVAPVASEDAQRFTRIGARPECVQVTGDPGVDSACERLERAPVDAPFLAAFEPGVPTLVAGSTWPEDDAVLLRAIRMVREGEASLRVIIAPHEPRVDVVERLLDELKLGAWKALTLADAEDQDSLVGGGAAVVVERVGVLASLYRLADVAYVGGGFGTRGLHSVIEPAAASAPVLFGPRHQASRAATGLIEESGARAVTGATGLAQAILAWLPGSNPEPDPGARARGYIDQQRGAAERTARLLLGRMRGAAAR